jgi:hypothetical protein
MFERDTAVKANTRNARNFEIRLSGHPLFAGWIVTRRTVDGTRRAVGKGLGIKASCALVLPRSLSLHVLSL